MKFTQARILFILLLALFNSSSLAQSNYKKGFIVRSNGDTLYGFINYKEWYRNPREFSFKTSLADKNTENYTVNNSAFFQVEGYTAYQRFPVLVSMNEVEFNNLTESSGQPEIKDTVFLQLLLKGKKVNLYSYRDRVKQRFYILENDQTTPIELGYRLALKNGTVTKFYDFRQQLSQLAQKLNDSALYILPEIQKSNYEQADLLKVTRLINREGNSVSILPARKKRKQLYVAAGINYSTIKYSGQNMITSEGLDNNGNSMYKNRKTSSFLPSIAVGTDVYFKPEVQKSYLKFEVSAAGIASKVHSLFKYNIYTVEELRNTYQLSGVILSFCPQVIINFLNREKLKAYVGIGPCVNYLLPFKNEMYQKTNQQNPPYSDKQTDDYIRLKDFYASFMLRAGITINNKIDISLCQSNPVELGDYKASILSAKYTSTQISVGYKFRQ